MFRKSILRCLRVALLVAMVFSALSTRPARAASLLVNSTADTVADEGQCTLREAIIAANTDTASGATQGECAAGSGPDSIDFDLFAPDLITLTSDLPALTGDVVIDGDVFGSANPIDGASAYRPFFVNAGVTAEIHKFSISGGQHTSGGAIYNLGTLTVVDSTFSGNTASSTTAGEGGGAIYNSGTLSIRGSTFDDNTSADSGGAIYNGTTGTLSLLDSSFSGNTVSSTTPGEGGGAIHNDGTVTVHTTEFLDNSALTGGGILNSGTATLSLFDSSFSANTAGVSAPGGGIRNTGTLTVSASTFAENSAGGSGGGIHNGGSGNMTVGNSTFSGNTTAVSGGGIFSGGTAVSTVINSTLAGNTASASGGGIFNSATLNYSNTIIADSVGGGDCVSTGSIGTNTNNLVEDSSCAASLAGDPKLGTLGNYGGKTVAFPILWDSPALDAGSNAVCAASPVNNLDQRGEPRPFDGNHDGTPTCDIGSFETKEPTLTTITSDAPDASVPSQWVTVTVSVEGLSMPTGLVKITGANTNCTITLAPATAVLATGACQVLFTSGGNKVLTASYEGDATHAKSLGTDTHTVWFMMKFLSQPGNDGWVRESTETSNVGGSVNATATTLRVGDDALDRQYRSILSFSTAGLPDTATIKRVQVFVKRKSVTGDNPIGTHGGLKVDIKKPKFGAVLGLGLDDFSARAGKLGACTMVPIATSNRYKCGFGPVSFSHINKTGATQLRLRFATGDNDDNSADVLNLFSGNSISANRPYLLVFYMP